MEEGGPDGRAISRGGRVRGATDPGPTLQASQSESLHTPRTEAPSLASFLFQSRQSATLETLLRPGLASWECAAVTGQP